MLNPGLRDDLGRLSGDLDHGTEQLAAERKIPHDEALADLVRRTLDSPPEVFVERTRRWGLPDLLVLAALVAVVGFAVRAGFILWNLEPPPENVALVTLGRSAPEARGSDLSGRTLLTVPIEPTSYALLGDLPTRVSAAVVSSSISDGRPPDPVAFFDDLLILEAESADGEVAVLVAIAPDEVEPILARLPGGKVHLLRRAAEPPTESRTASASPTAPSG